MIPRSFHFVRHGETDWNKAELMQGWGDIPLNETGRAQAVAVAPCMPRLNIDRLIVSDLLRARETAQILNTRMQKEIVIEPRLRERNFGVLEGKTYAEAQDWREKTLQENPSVIVEENGWPVAPDAEPYADFQNRVLRTLAEHLRDFAGERLLFVAHGGVYRVLRRQLFSDVAHSPNVQPYYFEKHEDGWQLHEIR